MISTPDELADDADLTASLGAFARASGLIVAVSGGPDSMALLRLVAGWAERHAHPPIHAATVDHGLRPDSRAEAETVALWAGAIGIPHAVLTWTGEKPVTRVQERARAARYALLARHAQSLGADVLMTAHHADDQAETILFRLVRGSNIAGLAGMAERTRRGALIHARPLIGRSKAELVAFCDTIGQAYFSDPSNEDPRYARTSMRRLSALLAEHGLGRSALLRLAGRSARAEAALAAATDAARAGLAAAPSETLFAVRGDELVGLADEIVLRLLIGEIARIGRRRTAPRLERAEALVSRLLPALRRGGTFAATLGGTRIRLAGGRLTIEAEKARRGAAQARLQQSPTSAERKCEPCCHEDRRFPWQGTPLGLN